MPHTAPHQQHKMNSRAEQELSDGVDITHSLRAVLSNYIQREKYQKKTNFDTVIQDRIISVKGYLKKRKAKHYTALTVLAVPVVFGMSLYGWFANPTNILLFAIGIFFLSFAIQAYSAFIIRGNISSEAEHERIAIKKAFYDIFFETKTSVQLIYYYAFAVFFFFIALAFMDIHLLNLLEGWIFNFGLFWIKTLELTELLFHPKIIYVLIFFFPMTYALGDFMFWKFMYGGVKNYYGDHE